MSREHPFLSFIDGVSEWSGLIVRWLVMILTFAMGYEVVARYLFGSPTRWAYDISYMLGGSFFLLGAAYTLRVGGHVRVDIIYNKFSPRGRAVIDIVFALLFFFPLWFGLLYKLIPYVYFSWKIQERTLESFWRPPIYPFKTVMPVGVFLLLLQGLAEFIRSLIQLAKGEEL